MNRKQSISIAAACGCTSSLTLLLFYKQRIQVYQSLLQIQVISHKHNVLLHCDITIYVEDAAFLDPPQWKRKALVSYLPITPDTININFSDF